MVLSRSTMVRLSSSALLRHHTSALRRHLFTPVLRLHRSCPALLLQPCCCNSAAPKLTPLTPNPIAPNLNHGRQSLLCRICCCNVCPHPVYSSSFSSLMLYILSHTPSFPCSSSTSTPRLLSHHNSFFHHPHSSSPTPPQLLLLSPPFFISYPITTPSTITPHLLKTSSPSLIIHLP